MEKLSYSGLNTSLKCLETIHEDTFSTGKTITGEKINRYN